LLLAHHVVELPLRLLLVHALSGHLSLELVHSLHLVTCSGLGLHLLLGNQLLHQHLLLGLLVVELVVIHL
jgi:hypothetical protein